MTLFSELYLRVEELEKSSHTHSIMMVRDKRIDAESKQSIKRASLETVEIGDTVGGVKIELESQKRIVRAAGEAIRVVAQANRIIDQTIIGQGI